MNDLRLAYAKEILTINRTLVYYIFVLTFASYYLFLTNKGACQFISSCPGVWYAVIGATLGSVAWAFVPYSNIPKLESLAQSIAKAESRSGGPDADKLDKGTAGVHKNFRESLVAMIFGNLIGFFAFLMVAANSNLCTSITE